MNNKQVFFLLSVIALFLWFSAYIISTTLNFPLISTIILMLYAIALASITLFTLIGIITIYEKLGDEENDPEKT